MRGPLRGPAAFDDGENNYQSDYLCTGREFAPCFPSERQARWHQRLRGHKGICADSRGWISMGDRLARGRSAAPGRRAAPPPRAGGSSPVGVPSTPSLVVQSVTDWLFWAPPGRRSTTRTRRMVAGGVRRRGVPVSNGAPPLLGGPWASKLRPPSERSVPRRRLAPRFAG